jgi:malate synthase
MIKTFRDAGPDFVLPDRSAVTMTASMMRAYTDLLVSTCRRRGAFAIGGMAAFIPSRRDAEVNERAFAKVREDKEREAGVRRLLGRPPRSRPHLSRGLRQIPRRPSQSA